MKQSWSLFSGFALVAIFTRFYFLANKPVHHDEAINAWFILQMWQNGYFKYDPSNYHGPLLFYLFQFSELFMGFGIESLRAVTASFSVLLILFLAYRAGKGVWGLYVAALVLLLSPANLFFSRSAIHESAFVFFQVLAFLGAYDLSEKKFKWGLPLFIYGTAGMICLKETFAIPLVSGLLAVVLFNFKALKVFLKELFTDPELKDSFEKHLVIGSFMALVLFTGVFQNGDGAADLFKAFMPWFKTAAGSAGHEKTFSYWFELILKNEFATLLSIFLCEWGLFSRDKTLRTVSFFALLQFVIYSIIPYKTPWCLISIQWPLLIGAGFVLQEIRNLTTQKLVLLTFAVAAVLQMPILNRLNYQNPIEMKHPYVYVQASYETKSLDQLLASQIRLHPDLKFRPIVIGTEDTWPFPWMFGRYDGLEFVSPKLNSRVDVRNNALVLIYDFEKAAEVDPLLLTEYWKFEFFVRDARKRAIAYLLKSEFPSVAPFQATVVGPAGAAK
jgi:uncharacterized protein (TIGR03663 family)